MVHLYILFIYLFFCLFFKFIFLISWRLITLQYCSGFESALDIHVFPILIPPPTSLSARSLWVFPVYQVGALVSCIQPGLVICISLIIYMFQCCSLETSHARLLPQSPKVCSIHLCLFFCFAYRVIVTIFLNSI